jgi:translation initiation factor 6 (eIF-6)
MNDKMVRRALAWLIENATQEPTFELTQRGVNIISALRYDERGAMLPAYQTLRLVLPINVDVGREIFVQLNETSALGTVIACEDHVALINIPMDSELATRVRSLTAPASFSVGFAVQLNINQVKGEEDEHG